VPVFKRPFVVFLLGILKKVFTISADHRVFPSISFHSSMEGVRVKAEFGTASGTALCAKEKAAPLPRLSRLLRDRVVARQDPFLFSN
jgi:hypothetical protein